MNGEKKSLGALVDDVCDCFEACWKSGSPPDFGRFLEGLPKLKEEATYELLCELAEIDIERRWRNTVHTENALISTQPNDERTALGTGPWASDYLKFFQKLTPDAAIPLSMIEAEYRLRLKYDHPLSIRDFIKRYPDHACLADSLQAITDEKNLAAETPTFRNSTKVAQNQLVIRCPQCSSSNEVAVDESLTEVVCSSCRAEFGVANESLASPLQATFSIGHFKLIERLGVGGIWGRLESTRRKTRSPSCLEDSSPRVTYARRNGIVFARSTRCRPVEPPEHCSYS